ncbi:MAG: MFS transporter [Vicingaceae bacterium]
MIEKGNKKIIQGWAMYDWANSAYSLVITSTIFPIFYKNITTVTNSLGDMVSEKVSVFGFEFNNSVLYSYSISFSFLLVVILAPLLSGIADYADNKKKFMQFFCYLGAASCAGLFFFDPAYLELSMSLVVLASIGFSGSLVFYNAFLPEIAEAHQQDRVSAQGYALGYVGSTILLIFNLSMIMFPDIYGLEEGGMAARISFLSVGVWWAAFAQIPFKRLPNKSFNVKREGHYLTKGYQEILEVFHDLKKNKRLKRYLLAFFVFNMAVQTVMYMAVTFGKDEIADMPDSGLIISILIIQIIAIGGAYFCSFLSALFGNIRTLSMILVVWLLICVLAIYTYTAVQFYLLAALVGFVMGGVQALSRSTYSKILPDTRDHTSYFSFYDVCEKLGIVLGTFIYGFVMEITESSRNSIFALTLFFALGLVLLNMVPEIKQKTKKLDLH